MKKRANRIFSFLFFGLEQLQKNSNSNPYQGEGGGAEWDLIKLNSTLYLILSPSRNRLPMASLIDKHFPKYGNLFKILQDNS